MIKVDDSDREMWTQSAKELGISVSEWIRRQCNERRTTGSNGHPILEDLPPSVPNVRGGLREPESGSEPVPALDRDVPAEGKPKPSGNLIDASVARKTGHEVGCDCALGCAPLRRMFKGAK